MTHIHDFYPSDKDGYERCTCGTYHSIALLSKEVLYENNYWSQEQGRSTLYEQIHNLNCHRIKGFSKVEKMLSHIDKPGKLLELACAPGSLMNKARAMGCKVTGVEPDYKNIDAIKHIAGHGIKILCGYFPDVDGLAPPYDYVIAMDLVEHIEDYRAFIQSVCSILAPGGKFIFMSPIMLEEGGYREIDFVAREHAWIFSVNYITEYLSSFFRKVEVDQWQVGHEIIVSTK